MRWSSGMAVVLLGIAVASSGCGDSTGGDDLTLAFQGWTSDGITQADSAGPNSAVVDVCQGLCGSIEDPTGEPFTQTRINAIFVNRGKADIVLDTYTVSVPGSGVPDQTFSATARIPGGRCGEDPQKQCALDSDCLGFCMHDEATVGVLLFDFTFKSLVVSGQCPSFEDPLGSVISQTMDVFVTFRGVDETDDGFNVSAAYQATFDNFSSCN
jgi:hypothetical protein